MQVQIKSLLLSSLKLPLKKKKVLENDIFKNRQNYMLVMKSDGIYWAEMFWRRLKNLALWEEVNDWLTTAIKRWGKGI